MKNMDYFIMKKSLLFLYTDFIRYFFDNLNIPRNYFKIYHEACAIDNNEKIIELKFSYYLSHMLHDIF